ncbi:MAG TPA: DUF192 domain-containing protein [Patescibacteria group bacterium]|nr:DUF192 domain-containing protein [Patescibacteria group bacterium]
MIKQILLPLLGVVAFIILIGLFVNNYSSLPGQKQLDHSSALPRATILVGSSEIEVEIAKNQTERELGLGGRTYLDPDSGMLFIFEGREMPGFWMKGMLIPIDIIWIADGKVAEISERISVPALGTPDSELLSYFPAQPVEFVLEVNSGFSDRNEIKVGDKVDLANALK